MSRLGNWSLEAEAEQGARVSRGCWRPKWGFILEIIIFFINLFPSSSFFSREGADSLLYLFLHLRFTKVLNILLSAPHRAETRLVK